MIQEHRKHLLLPITFTLKIHINSYVPIISYSVEHFKIWSEIKSIKTKLLFLIILEQMWDHKNFLQNFNIAQVTYSLALLGTFFTSLV